MMKYIFFVVTLISCNNAYNDADLKLSTERLDTIQSVPPGVYAKPYLFETAFTSGTKQQVKDATLTLYGITLGQLKIVSGSMIACDPGHIDEYGIPFTQVFPKGAFPVQLSIANLANKETIAFARVNFSDAPVDRWEFALQPGQNRIPVGGKKMHGYSVDLGVGVFMDTVASNALDKSNLTDLDADLYKKMDKHRHNDWRYTMYDVGQHNLAAFSTGMGDGYYATFIGFDATGKPCRLLTDFGVIDWKTNEATN